MGRELRQQAYFETTLQRGPRAWRLVVATPGISVLGYMSEALGALVERMAISIQPWTKHIELRGLEDRNEPSFVLHIPLQNEH